MQSPIALQAPISVVHAIWIHAAHSVSPNLGALPPLPPEHAAPATTAAAIATIATVDPCILRIHGGYTRSGGTAYDPRMRFLRALPLVVIAASAACSPGDDGGRARSPYEEPGPHPVGNLRFALTDSAGRVLLTEVWYPAAESERAAAEDGAPIEDFVPAGADHDDFVGLLASAPDPGTRRQTRSKLDAIPAADPALLPVVVFSHCHECLRFSSFSVAERLASWGFAVLAPDHADNTLFDGLAGDGVEITDDFLGVRSRDIALVLDSALSPTAVAIPAALRGRLDPARVGMFGHSFGAATIGRVLQDDPRVKAGFAMGAPVQSPLFPSVTLANIAEPMALLLLEKDESIGSIGNDFIGQNFEAAVAPVWLFSLQDAGHWSVSDLCGIVPELGDGCIGDATWVDPDDGRGAAAAWATAFFELTLEGEGGAEEHLENGLGLGDVEARE